MTIRAARLPLLLLLEVMWGWPLVAIAAQFFSGGAGAGPSPISLLIVVLGAAAFVSVLGQFDVGEASTRVIGVAATLAMLVIVVATEYGTTLDIHGERGAAFGAALALVALWIRGVLRGREGGSFDAVARSALFGLIPVAIAAGSQPAVNGPELFGELAIAYVPMALLVLALHQAGEPGRPVTALTSQWGPMAVAALVAGAALAISAAAIDPGSFGFLGPLTEPLRIAGDAVGRYVLGPILAAVAWLFRQLPGFSHSSEIQPRPPERPERPPPEKNDDGWGFLFGYLLDGLVAGALVLIALLALALIFYRLRHSPDDDEDDPTETERDGSLRNDLADLLAGLGQRFRRGSREGDSAFPIRRLYAEMLGAAANDGLERPVSATPAQFAPILEQRYDSSLPSDITNAFIASRYGGHDITEMRVRELESQWRDITAAVRQSRLSNH